jgi:hypothetical protein
MSEMDKARSDPWAIDTGGCLIETFEEPKFADPDPIPEPASQEERTSLSLMRTFVKSEFPESARPDPIPDPDREEAVMLLVIMLALPTNEMPEETDPDPIPEPSTHTEFTSLFEILIDANHVVLFSA